MQARKSLKNYFCSGISIFLTIVQDTVHLAQNWIWGWRRQGLWWSRWAGSSQAHAKPAQDDPKPLIEGWNCDSSKPPDGVCRKDFGGRRNVESSWRCARISSPSQSSRSGSPGGEISWSWPITCLPDYLHVLKSCQDDVEDGRQDPDQVDEVHLVRDKILLVRTDKEPQEISRYQEGYFPKMSPMGVDWHSWLINTHSIIW